VCHSNLKSFAPYHKNNTHTLPTQKVQLFILIVIFNNQGSIMSLFSVFLFLSPASMPVSLPTSEPTSIPVVVSSEVATPKESDPPRNIQVKANAELGFLSVLSHKVQLSKTGTLFDYRSEGGQDLLFRFERFSVDVSIREKNELTLLYQPLELVENVVLARDVTQDNILFPAQTDIEARYSFPFWRGSYLRKIRDTERSQISLGGSMQIRNANISFRSLDGELLQSNRDVGPVPLLKLKTKNYLSNDLWIATETDGIYAPIKYLNGDDVDVVGALLDTSVRLGLDFDGDAQAFLNLRYLGGGAEGTGDAQGTGDGFVKNWLNFFTVSLGGTYDLNKL
jgi:hypothetical protein